MNAKPIGGINLFVSLMIIAGHKVKKEFASLEMKKTILSIVIFGIVIIYVINNLLSGFSPESLLKKEASSCTEIYHDTGENNVILRIDDVQANYNRDIEIKMLDELIEKNMTATLGVIPYNLLEDEKITNYLKKHRCDFEIALHGYDNTNYEFDFIEYQEAREKIKKGLEILNDIEPKVITFIPPNNRMSEGAEKAVLEGGIKIISGGSWNSEYGFTISTYDWIDLKLNDASLVLDKCEETLSNNKPCVIMIHPQDYTTNNKFDKKKYDEYLELLNGIKELDANVVNFRDMHYKDRIKLN